MNARLIIDQPAPGVWNMALDEALLIDAAANGAASLRLYSWSEPTLSLGYFQRYADREQHAASQASPVVRRQTGGGAILHDRELTYSLLLPECHPYAKQAGKLYTTVHQEILDALRLIISGPASGWSLQIRGQCPERRAHDEPFLCFQRESQGDGLLVAARDNLGCGVCKILGSAQRRYRGAVLQHGSLLLERSPAAPELSGIRDLTHRTVASDALAAAISMRLAAALEMQLVEASWPPELESKAAELANNKYGSPSWTKCR